MKRSLLTLFCVGAASASAGPLVSALLAAAVAPDAGSRFEVRGSSDPATPIQEASAATQFSADVIRGGTSLRLEVKAL
jgi:hypothetical protein